jgi:hypothetical protein
MTIHAPWYPVNLLLAPLLETQKAGTIPPPWSAMDGPGRIARRRLHP